MSRPLAFIPWGHGGGGGPKHQAHYRQARIAEATRGSQRFIVHQNVEVLDVDGASWIPGRLVEDRDTYARVEVLVPGRGPQIRKVTKERLRPQTENL